MIPSIDSHVYRELSIRIKIIRKNRYIIDEALKDIDIEAKENFIKTYCGEKPKKDITLFYGFPQTKEGFEASYAVTLGQGAETHKTLGGISGDYFSREGLTLKEQVKATLSDDKSKIWLTVSRPISSLVGIVEVSFSDDCMVEDNHVVIEYKGNEFLLNDEFDYTVTYVPLERKDNDVRGLAKGFRSRDTVEITCLSTNYDVARCLDAMLKIALITMREGTREQYEYSLQSLSYNALAPVDINGDTMVFGRTTSVEYTIAYDIDEDSYIKLSEIVLNERIKDYGTD